MNFKEYTTLSEKKESLCIDEFIDKRSAGAKKIQHQSFINSLVL